MKPRISLRIILLLVLCASTAKAQFQIDALSLNNTEVTLHFRADASAAVEDFEVEASPDLGRTTWIVIDSVIADLGGGEWRATVTETADRMFFRVTNNGVPITASFPIANASVQEGENNAIVVTFSEPFTGTLNYSITSFQGEIAGQIEVENSASVTIPIDIEDNAEVDPLEPLIVNLEAASDGVSYKIGAGSGQILTVVENDEFRAGILDSGNDIIDLPIRFLVTRQNGTTTAFLKAGTHGMIPPNPGNADGDWPFSSFTLTETSLSASVRITVPADETIYSADTDLLISLQANGSENISGLVWNGTFTMDSTVPSKAHLNATRSGTFLVGKEPSLPADTPPPTPIEE